MNKELLLESDGTCKLCRLIDDHTEECPGTVIERMSLYVKYSGRNCSRGCCGGVDGEFEAQSYDDAVESCASYVEETIGFSADLRYVAEDCDIEHAVKAVLAKRREAEKAKEAEEKAAAVEKQRQKSLAALEAERVDLTPEAYERRKATLQAS